MIQGYKCSLAEKDSEIIRLKASSLEFASFFREQLAEAKKKVSKFVLGAKNRLATATPFASTACFCSYSLSCPCFSSSSEGVNFDNDFCINGVASKDVPSSSTTVVNEQPSKEQNKEWVDAMVDVPNKDIEGATVDKVEEVVVQCVIHRVSQDVSQVDTDTSLVPESKLAFFNAPNVVVSLSAEKDTRNAPLTPKILL
uniref:Uncharacterized protein n=1 Tax=Tanacetum cinerariifolium TaxID=118510 RepID=A0A6L2MDI6_TANCI|nr:hypothetical protein [Tanacetum cinerariifolium]